MIDLTPYLVGGLCVDEDGLADRRDGRGRALLHYVAVAAGAAVPRRRRRRRRRLFLHAELFLAEQPHALDQALGRRLRYRRRNADPGRVQKSLIKINIGNQNNLYFSIFSANCDKRRGVNGVTGIHEVCAHRWGS